MKTIGGLKYSREHEWVRLEDDLAYIGITDYAQENLGDVVYIEFPGLNDTIVAGDVLSVVESVKAASDLYAPVSGTIIAVNESLEDEPGAVNTDPYDDGWLFEVKLSDSAELDGLKDAEAYEESLED